MIRWVTREESLTGKHSMHAHWILIQQEQSVTAEVRKMTTAIHAVCVENSAQSAV